MVAFMFAGLVAMGYGAPSPMCAAVHCDEGGVPCSLSQLPMPSGSFGNTSVFAMDQNLAKLNGFTSPVLCFGNDTNIMFSTLALTRTSDVLCASVPTAVTQTNGLSSSLNAYLHNLPASLRPNANGSLSDLLQALDPQSFVSLNPLRYICYNVSLGGTFGLSFSSLCDTWALGINTAQPLSVSPSGAYLTAATLLASGALLFAQDDVVVATASSAASSASILMLDFFDNPPLNGSDSVVVEILAGIFGCCMLGLGIWVGAAHYSKKVCCHMQVLVVPPISKRPRFRHLAAELSRRFPSWRNRAPQA